MSTRNAFGLLAALGVLALGAVGCVGSEAAVPTTTTALAPAVESTTTTTSLTADETSDESAAESTTSTTSTTTTTAPLDPLLGLAVDTVIEVRRPVLALADPDDDRLFIVEQAGIVQVLPNGDSTAATPFLDITDVVGANGIEQGLLGMALHPRFAENGRFFVYYTDPSNHSHLVEYAATSDLEADSESGRELLFVEQPTDRHNAGMLTFGPDGYLWLSLGEGGAASVNAQSPETLLGSILRIDVDTAASGSPYVSPSDNPFTNGGGAPEVWAFGLRNPWRFSIDPVQRLLYIGDVGHSEWEEIDVVSIDDDAGANFGWLPMEGTHCFLNGCDPDLYTLPVVEYSHEGGNCSVTGGFVYRGEAIPELTGHYFYADWCGGWVRSFLYADGEATDMVDWSDQLGELGQITSFGLDGQGELLITTWEGGVYRVVPLRG